MTHSTMLFTMFCTVCFAWLISSDDDNSLKYLSEFPPPSMWKSEFRTERDDRRISLAIAKSLDLVVIETLGPEKNCSVIRRSSDDLTCEVVGLITSPCPDNLCAIEIISG